MSALSLDETNDIASTQTIRSFTGKKGTVLFVSPLLPATGNATTALRLRDVFTSLGYSVILLNAFETTPAEILKTTFDHDISCIVGLHARHSGGVISEAIQMCKKSEYSETTHRNISDIPFIIVLGGTDVNVDIPLSISSKDDTTTHANTVLTTMLQSSVVVAFTNDMLKKVNLLLSKISNSHTKTTVIPQGLNKEINTRKEYTSYWLRKKLSISSESILLLLPSGIRKVKDPNFVIDCVFNWAIERQKESLSSVHLVIIGRIRDDTLYESISKKIYSIQQQWLQLSKTKKVPPILYHETVEYHKLLVAMKESDAVINTSESEGMSCSLAEAMAIGTIVIARNNLGNHELVCVLPNLVTKNYTQHNKTQNRVDTESDFVKHKIDPRKKNIVVETEQNKELQCIIDNFTCGFLFNDPNEFIDVCKSLFSNTLGKEFGTKRKHLVEKNAEVFANTVFSHKVEENKWGSLLNEHII